MSPYLTRKHTLSQVNPQDSQLANKASSKQVKSNARSATSKASKVKDDTGVTSRLRSAAAKKKVNMPTGSSIGVSHEEEQKVTRRRVLGRSIGKKVSDRSKKAVTRNNAETKKQELEDTKRKRIRKKINNNSPSLRQLSLKESFSKQSRVRKLHSRQIAKNYKEDSTLIGESLSPAHQDSIVLVEKLSVQKGKKLPVYRCASPENPTKNTSEVYEFKCDVNESRERLTNKRKKRPVKKTIVGKKKKIVSDKQNVQKPEVYEEEPMNVKSKGTVEESPLRNKVSVELVVENQLEKEPVENLEKEVKGKTEEPVAQSNVPGDKSKEQIKAAHSKPAIISVQDLSSKKLTIMDNFPKSNSEDFRPFRLTNIFGNKLMVPQKSTMNHSIFEKSLSPIMKPLENFNLDSPWRSPQLLTFSHVRNVFHSTPINKGYDISGRKLVRSVLNESMNSGNIAKVRDTMQKNNENVCAEGYKNANNSKKKSISSSRKFGTVITNIEHSLQSNVAEETSERVVIEAENVPPTIQLTSEITSSTINASKFDNTEDKENSALTSPSPEKVHKRGMKNVKALSPQKITSTKIDEQKENFDPQPGPSGLQSNRIFNEQTVLRQSNLNNFLNIMEMPQSTTIKTSHGLFDDVQSAAPVSSKPVIKLHEFDTELKHAFGFGDDSNQDVSPIQQEVTKDEQKAIEKTVEKQDALPFARISVTEIKNNLLPRKPLETARNERNIKSRKVETKRSPAKSKQKVQFDITHFSDTFDVLSEISETPAMSPTNVPLFADCEPSYFTQPPLHLYKRKRDLSFRHPEESDEEDEESFEHATKRKKIDKMKVEQKKRLMQWVQDINRTFDEIDQHELMVE
ncbi:uncharacterized protein LOC143368163 [Andrena cerasifolii]|uniref:uncharacterized protein LOC143368163 n=1 Tax=Andrena cerasifolii TaxID=2819439 RepID=UPI004037A206